MSQISKSKLFASLIYWHFFFLLADKFCLKLRFKHYELRTEKKELLCKHIIYKSDFLLKIMISNFEWRYILLFLFHCFFFCSVYNQSVNFIFNLKRYVKFTRWCFFIYISYKFKILVLKAMISKVQGHLGVTLKNLFLNSIAIILVLSFKVYL